jgi:hypothetical protein
MEESEIINEIDEMIIKMQMGYEVEALNVETLIAWKKQILKELTQANLKGVDEGMKLDPHFWERMYFANTKKT